MKNENTTKQFISKNYIQIGTVIASVFIWLITFFVDHKTFTKDALNMNCLPIDTAMVSFMHITSKWILLILIIGIFEFILYSLRNKKLFFYFLLFFTIYVGCLLINYPGYYMSDDTVIFGYATRYYPVYWHNYLTSLYYMVAMSLIPASTGPIILNDLILAMVFSFISFKVENLFATKWKYLIVICGLLPFVILSGLMCFRPALYAPFFLFLYAFLFFEKKEQKEVSLGKLLWLSFLTAILCFWRSEGILLILFMLFLLPMTYNFTKKEYIKKIGIFLLSFILVFSIIKIPQSMGEQKYYGKDYLIVSTIRPLSLIIHREQTYDGAEEDLENIDAVVELDYMSYETMSCSSYNRFNSDFNNGHFTESGATPEQQDAYIKSALRLILHNLDLFIGERIQLFCVENGLSYPKNLVMNMAPVTTAEFPSYQLDRDYGYELVNGNSRLGYETDKSMALFLFRFGGEGYIPMLILLMGMLVYTLVSKRWFAFLSLLSVLGRECVIFLTAPAGFIQYNYPAMFVIAFFFIILVLEIITEKTRKI